MFDCDLHRFQRSTQHELQQAGSGDERIWVEWKQRARENIRTLS